MGKEGKRLILAAGLSFLVLIGFQFLNSTAKKPQAQPAPMAQTALKGEATPEAVAKSVEIKKGEQEKEAVTKKPLLKGEELDFETPYALVKMDTKGGCIKSWVLNDYKENGKNVNMIWNNEQNIYPGTLLIPSLKFEDAVVYTAKKTENGFEFSAVIKNTAEIKKTFTFRKDNFACDIIINIKSLNKEAKKIADAKLFLGAGVNNHFVYVDEQKIPEEKLKAIQIAVLPYAHQQYLNESSVKNTFALLTKTNPDGTADMSIKEAPKETDKGKLSWIGIKDKYYLSAFILNKEAGYKGYEYGVLYTPEVKLSAASVSKGVRPYKVPYIMPLTAVIFPEFDAVKGENLEVAYYSGPLVYEKLKAFNVGLHHAMELGWSWFAMLGLWMLIAMKWIFIVTKNWGWTIIILTIIVKAITWWPTQKSFIAMKKMTDIQPEITAMRERFKDDPKKQSEEMMRIYKARGVNPIGGCLPMLIQIPIFVALYAVLANAIELKGASFLIWKDLSVMDPYFVLITIMIVTMIVQQKMTPSADPQQAKMMMWIMPIMMAIFFWSLPAGVILYWVVQNLLSIAQQVMVNNKLKKT